MNGKNYENKNHQQRIRAIMDNRINLNGECLNMCEYIKDRLYFITMPHNLIPKSNLDYHFFCIDDELVYLNYYSDFGPLNLGALYRYCVKLNTKLNYYASGKKRVVHYTTIDPNKRANAAFLIAGYAIIFLKSTPTQAYQPLLTERAQPFRPFQDASSGRSVYTITLYQCIEGLFKALRYGFFDFNDFDLDNYERHEKIQHGDMTWIVPDKLIAFCGPCSFYKPPKYYVDYFLINQVTAVVRLNKKFYDARSFTKFGIAHYELYMEDGSIPSKHITQKFLKICENTPGGIAVHCKAGLGRTGSLIGAYLVKHYHMAAREAIAWLRICRPGCVIGRQQTWLEDMEGMLWKLGEDYRFQHYGASTRIPHHSLGIYSIKGRPRERTSFGHSRLKQKYALPEVIHIAMDGNIGDSGRKQFGGINTKQVEAFVEASTSSGVTSHLRQETNRPLQVLHKSNRMYMSKNLKEDLTEGDKLNAIKAYRQNNNLIMIKTNSLGVKDAP